MDHPKKLQRYMKPFTETGAIVERRRLTSIQLAK